MTAEDIRDCIEPDAALAFMLDPSHGTGTAADLDVAAEIARDMPIWLAGGLTPDNVVDVIKTVRPWCVDVSTGVETDGAKDPAKIAAFIRAAKGVPV
jgi:phosphoribosylanthranilate isomerase